jgi:hypothetical protein
MPPSVEARWTPIIGMVVNFSNTLQGIVPGTGVVQSRMQA